MATPQVTVTKTGPGLKGIRTALDKLENTSVFVGIPASTTLRKGEEINNASIAFIMTHGSALRKIPARPFLEPGILQAKGPISVELGAAAQAIFAERDPDKATRHLKRAGTIGANAVKRYVREGNNLAPNAPSTIKRKGSARPLIDSSRMIKSVTYILLEERKETIYHEREELFRERQTTARREGRAAEAAEDVAAEVPDIPAP